jgi:hypothetical protein
VADWFRRFGDIPGVAYMPPSNFDRSKLSGHDAVPEIHVYEFDGRRRENLMWRFDGRATSASPAHELAFGSNAVDQPTAEILQRVAEGLELPGEPSDYHFLIQGSAGALWDRRRAEPWALAEVERLCRLDIQLVQALPSAVMADDRAEPKFFRITTFPLLIGLYEREGFLREALEVAEMAVRYGQEDRLRNQLVERIQAVEAEANVGP